MDSQLPFPVVPGRLETGGGPEWLVHVSPHVLEGLARVSVSLLGAQLGLATAGEPGAQHLCARAASGGTPGEDAAIAAAARLCERVVAEGRVLSLERVPLEDGAVPELRSFLGAPVRVQGRVMGALAALGPEPRAWDGDARAALWALADAAAAELERARLKAANGELAETVRRSESWYGQVTKHTSVGIYTIDLRGRFIELNDRAAEVLGRPLEELLDTDFRDSVAPEDRAKATELFRKRLSGAGSPDEIELRVIRPTGERRLLYLCSAPAVENGAITGMHGVARDITEERAREMQLRRAERMASVAPLLTGVCHELNNPLTSIKSFAELLLLDERPPEDREALEIVQREAHRAAKIVSDLRLVARQRQETGTERGLVDLNQAVRQVLQAPGCSLSGIRLQEDLAPVLPPLWAVRLHVEQVILQLVLNAVQAMQDRPGPRDLTVRTYAGGIGAVLQVEDTGPGIHPDHLDRIFDPFWTTRGPGEGSGLGLSLVNGIVSDHGGRIGVDSTPGGGTRFAVELPIAVEPPMALGPAEGDTSATRALRVLVVDDEAAIRYSLTRYLERRGHRVEEASDGEAALERLADAGEDAFDAIVADLRMPGLGGGELLCRLRQRGGNLDDRLIFITGDTDGSDLDGEVDRAGVPVVQKPFELAEIAQIIEAQAGMSIS